MCVCVQLSLIPNLPEFPEVGTESPQNSPDSGCDLSSPVLPGTPAKLCSFPTCVGASLKASSLGPCWLSRSSILL